MHSSTDPRLSRRRLLASVGWLGAGAVGVACGPVRLLLGPDAPLADVEADRHVLTLDGRNPEPITIRYRLPSPATVSLFLTGPTGPGRGWEEDQLVRLREDVQQPAGEHEIAFDGTLPVGAGGVRRQVLPAGQHTLVLRSRIATRSGDAGISFTIESPDREVPRIEALAVSPDRISPNDPDLSDTAAIAYRLTKPATIHIWAEGPGGVRRAVMAPSRQAAGDQSFRWSISPIERRTPDGDYRLVVEARDAAGNVGEASAALNLSGTERPIANITSVEFEPKRLAAGEPVRVRITVKNTGRVPLRTEGPPPGYRYTTLDTVASVEGGRYRPRPRYWSVGVDWAGGLGPEGARYPYRWSLGRDLQPGEEATIEGEIRILEHWDRIWLYAGLIQEGVSYYIDKFGQQQLDIVQ